MEDLLTLGQVWRLSGWQSVCVFVCVYRLCLWQTNKQFLHQILSLTLSSSTVHANLHVEMTAFQNHFGIQLYRRVSYRIRV